MTALERKNEIKNYVKQLKKDNGKYVQERDIITGEVRYLDMDGMYYNTPLFIEAGKKYENRNKAIGITLGCIEAGSVIAGYYLAAMFWKKVLS